MQRESYLKKSSYCRCLAGLSHQARLLRRARTPTRGANVNKGKLSCSQFTVSNDHHCRLRHSQHYSDRKNIISFATRYRYSIKTFQ